MLRYTVDVTTQAQHTQVLKHSDSVLRVKVTAPAVDGKANKALISVLADYFGVPKSKILILSGEKRKRKIVGVME